VLPTDWESSSSCESYNLHPVPYYLAPLWDSGLRHRSEEAQKKQGEWSHGCGSTGTATGRVPAELRQKLKKARGAKTLLQQLEEQVRLFVQEWRGVDSEDEEIVFVGRDASQRHTSDVDGEAREKLILDSLVDDQGARFG
jgi:hypothetical protein